LAKTLHLGFRVYFNNNDNVSGDRGFAINYRQEVCNQN
jgi:hypothetical protein